MWFKKDEPLKTQTYQLYFPLWASWPSLPILYPHQMWDFKHWSHSDSAEQVNGQKQKPQAFTASHCPISLPYDYCPISQKNYFINLWPTDHTLSLNNNNYKNSASGPSGTPYLQKDWKPVMVKKFQGSQFHNSEWHNKGMRNRVTKKSGECDTEDNNNIIIFFRSWTELNFNLLKHSWYTDSQIDIQILPLLFSCCQWLAKC